MSQLEKLRERIPYDEERYENNENYEAYLNALLEDTSEIALNHLYPFLNPRPNILSSRYLNWQIRACMELDEVAGFNGFKSYSENGLSFTRATDGMLSISILSELIPYAGVPEKETVISND